MPATDRRVFSGKTDHLGSKTLKGGTIPKGEYKIHQSGHGWLHLTDAIQPPYTEKETLYTLHFSPTISEAGEELFLRERDIRLSHKRVFTDWCKKNKMDPKTPLIKHIESGKLTEAQLKSARVIFKDWSPEDIRVGMTV